MLATQTMNATSFPGGNRVVFEVRHERSVGLGGDVMRAQARQGGAMGKRHGMDHHATPWRASEAAPEKGVGVRGEERTASRMESVHPRHRLAARFFFFAGTTM